MSLDQKRVVLSVIIVSYNTREVTLRCLAALYKNLHAIVAEVIVVDNNSGDGSVPAMRNNFPSVNLIEVAYNSGFAAANNRALKLARGEFVLLLNSDAFLNPGALDALLEYLRLHPKVAVAGPRLLNDDGTLQKSCYKFPSPLRACFEHTLLAALLPDHPVFGDYRAWPHDEVREVDFVIGACMLIRKSAIEQVGLFDERFFMYCEETDLCRRLHLRGWSVAFTPKAAVVHLNGASGRKQSTMVFNEFSRSGEYYIHKHYGSVGLGIHRLCFLSGSCIRIIVFALPAAFSLSYRRKMSLWLRIFTWTIGMRGDGLSPRKNAYTAKAPIADMT